MLFLHENTLISFEPLKPHFYIVKLGFTGVYIIFLIVRKSIDCGTRWNRLAEAVLTSTHRLCARWNRLAEAVLTSTYNLF